MMIRERDLLPLHERQAARVAIEKLVEQLGSQAAVGEVLGCSQQAINKVTAYTKIGPTIMRNLLDAGVKYGGGASERDVRAIADKYEPVLKDADVGLWVETLLREIRATLTRPRLDQKAEKRLVRSKQRIIRKLHGSTAAKRAVAAASTPKKAQG
jgi:hypothetical protein